MIDFTKIVSLGHSFGAATALDLAVKKKVSRGIVLDPWYLMRHEGIDNPTEQNHYWIDRGGPPTLIVCTEDFPREMDAISLSVYS